MKRPQTIFRVERAARDFTTISNSLLRDQRVSHETRGLLCDLLSRPLDWEICVSELIAKTPSGREKIYRMLKEAERFGYITRDQARRDNGTMGKHYYVVTDRPESRVTESRNAADRVPENRKAVEPDAAQPLPADQPQQKKESNKRQIEQNSSASDARSLAYVEDGEGIRAATFAFTWAWVDAAADAEGVPADQARKLAKVLALELIAAPPTGTGYFATFRRMLREHKHGATRRPAKARQAEAKPHWRDVQRETVAAVQGAIERAKAAAKAAGGAVQ